MIWGESKSMCSSIFDFTAWLITWTYLKYFICLKWRSQLITRSTEQEKNRKLVLVGNKKTCIQNKSADYIGKAIECNCIRFHPFHQFDFLSCWFFFFLSLQVLLLKDIEIDLSLYWLWCWIKVKRKRRRLLKKVKYMTPALIVRHFVGKKVKT